MLTRLDCNGPSRSDGVRIISSHVHEERPSVVVCSAVPNIMRSRSEARPRSELRSVCSSGDPTARLNGQTRPQVIRIHLKDIADVLEGKHHERSLDENHSLASRKHACSSGHTRCVFSIAIHRPSSRTGHMSRRPPYRSPRRTTQNTYLEEEYQGRKDCSDATSDFLALLALPFPLDAALRQTTLGGSAREMKKLTMDD